MTKFKFILLVVFPAMISSYIQAQSCNSRINDIHISNGKTAYFIDSILVKSNESLFFDPAKITSMKTDKNPVYINGVQFSNKVYITTDGSIEFVGIKSLNPDRLSNNAIYTVNDKLIICPDHSRIDKNLILKVETGKPEEYSSNMCITNLIQITTRASLNKKNKNIRIK